ncbi:MAG: hypothetical protein KDD66_10210 [Bdellovibrionales bacterium]|nr:hypothetical protein [Bdellovibrionales bacterium]
MKVTKLATIAFVSTVLLSGTPALAAQSDLEFMLSARHLEWNSDTQESFEAAAGGKQALVDQLIQLSHSDSVSSPVAMRAAHILANEYADDPEVSAQVLAVIEEDIGAEDREGLARLYASKVDRVSSTAAKRTIATAAADRGAASESFRPYAQKLLNSSDRTVRAIAAQRLE